MKPPSVVIRKVNYKKITFIDGEVTYFLDEACTKGIFRFNERAIKYSEYTFLSIPDGIKVPTMIKATQLKKSSSCSNPLEEEDLYDDPLN